MDIFNGELTEIRDEILAKISHPYLGEKIGEPEIDEDKLILLYSIFYKANVPYTKIKRYIVTSFLVQFALDTHERVSLSQMGDKDEDLYNRQLTVLAGDYYSGLYYNILAQNSDLSMIGVLAEAIKKINEYKISIYEKKQINIEFFLKRISQIESTLFTKIADIFHLSEMKEFISKVCLLKRLLVERESYISYGLLDFAVVFKNDQYGHHHPDFYLGQFNTYIERTKGEIEKVVDFKRIHPIMSKRLDQLIKSANTGKQKVLEEG